jgi:hypothetical protein
MRYAPTTVCDICGKARTATQCIECGVPCCQGCRAYDPAHDGQVCRRCCKRQGLRTRLGIKTTATGCFPTRVIVNKMRQKHREQT